MLKKHRKPVRVKGIEYDARFTHTKALIYLLGAVVLLCESQPAARRAKARAERSRVRWRAKWRRVGYLCVLLISKREFHRARRVGKKLFRVETRSSRRLPLRSSALSRAWKYALARRRPEDNQNRERLLSYSRVIFIVIIARDRVAGFCRRFRCFFYLFSRNRDVASGELRELSLASTSSAGDREHNHIGCTGRWKSVDERYSRNRKSILRMPNGGTVRITIWNIIKVIKEYYI